MSIAAEQIKKLRELTGAGVLDAKRALENAAGDFDKAADVLKAKGIAAAAKKSERVARQGLVQSYIHAGGKVGALLELNCETDFVARTQEFSELAHDLALQIVAAKARYVSSDDIPLETREELRRVFAAQAESEGKKGDLVNKIVEGKLTSYYKDNCLLNQPFIRDESQTILDLVKAKIAKLGENIVVRRFSRFELGE